MQKLLTLAITTYNRPFMTLECFENVIDNPLIGEIVITDDNSSHENFEILHNKLKILHNKKIKLFRNDENLGMLENKRRAVQYSTNEWVILFDSDNVIYNDYIKSFFKIVHHYPDTIYCPAFAKPHFDYRKFEGINYTNKYVIRDGINAISVLEQINDPVFKAHLNTCNYIVNRDYFLKNFPDDDNIKETDTLWIAFHCLKAGGWFHIVPGMHYLHNVHEGSGWLKNADENMVRSNEIINTMRNEFE